VLVAAEPTPFFYHFTLAHLSTTRESTDMLCFPIVIGSIQWLISQRDRIIITTACCARCCRTHPILLSLHVGTSFYNSRVYRYAVLPYSNKKYSVATSNLAKRENNNYHCNLCSLLQNPPQRSISPSGYNISQCLHLRVGGPWRRRLVIR
jgi:hypothetical protein